MDRVASADPRSWPVLPNARYGLKPRKRTTVQVWITSSHIGIGDDVYAYLRRPRYLQIRIQGHEVALRPCGVDEEGARPVHPPSHPRKFYHLKVHQAVKCLRQGDYNNLRFRQVAGEPYVVFDAAAGS